LVVERMRMGDGPIQAVQFVLERVVESFGMISEKDQCALIALAPDGRFASGAVRKGFEVAVTKGARSELVGPDVVLVS
jgi:isoaspartyl peptidase/L-asparaginase-like protein (Ntn-hydrolase superfamily)